MATKAKMNYKRLADSLHSRIVVQRAGGRCQIGRPGCLGNWTVGCAHIISRREPMTRHDLLNGLAACTPCHQWFDSLEQHERIVWLKKHYKGIALYAVRMRKRILNLAAPYKPDWKENYVRLTHLAEIKMSWHCLGCEA